MRKLLSAVCLVHAAAFVPPFRARTMTSCKSGPDFDYLERQASFDLASKEDVKAAMESGAVWLDVRTEAEVAQTALPVPFTNLPVPIVDASALPEDKSTTILCFCAIGARSAGARMSLQEFGYTNVLNAGGIGDVLPLFS